MLNSSGFDDDVVMQDFHSVSLALSFHTVPYFCFIYSHLSGFISFDCVVVGLRTVFDVQLPPVMENHALLFTHTHGDIVIWCQTPFTSQGIFTLAACRQYKEFYFVFITVRNNSYISC